jgi:hypothetical protein
MNTDAPFGSDSTTSVAPALRPMMACRIVRRKPSLNAATAPTMTTSATMAISTGLGRRSGGAAALGPPGAVGWVGRSGGAGSGGGAGVTVKPRFEGAGSGTGRAR